MKKMKILSGIVLATMLATSGCHSYYDVKVKQQPLNTDSYYLLEPPLYAGDNIRYQLKDGQKGELTVSHTDPKNIYGEDGTVVQVAQVSELGKRDISKGKTAAAVGGGVATGAVVVVMIFSLAAAAGIAALAAG